MDVVIASPEGRNLVQLSDCELVCAFGADENDFELTCPPGHAPGKGCRVYALGTEFGGIVDAVRSSTKDGGTVVCRGRSWHGVLAGKRLVPDGGASHMEASGTVHDAVSDIISRAGLEGLFSAAPCQERVRYTYERFCDAWSGLCSMLASSGLRPDIRYTGGRVSIGAEPRVSVGGRVDSDTMDLDIDRIYTRTNHLVCGGTGEQENRTVIHFYADADGSVSHEQTLFGADEIAAFYDCSNADADQLEKDGRRQLESMQTGGEVTAEARDGLRAHYGDVVTATDNGTGARVTAPVEKVTARISNGRLTVGYQMGKPSPGTSASTIAGTAEGSGAAGGQQGREYLAGDGLRLVGNTFLADVTGPMLDVVSARAEAAAESASDAEAAAGLALQTADGKADRAHSHDYADLRGVPQRFPPAPHGHRYAASETDGGAAAAAVRLAAPRTIRLSGAVSGSATFDGSSDVEIRTEGDGAAAAFLAAHPVGYIVYSYERNPNEIGGRWEQVPSVGAFAWVRRG